MAPRNRVQLEQLLTEFFRSSTDPMVDAVYLFGSRARGDQRADSDVDVGVLFGADASRGWPLPELEIQRSLEDRCPLSFDVVSLREAPPDLVRRVLQDGVLVFERDRARRIAFEVRAREEYFDVEPMLVRYRRPRSAA